MAAASASPTGGMVAVLGGDADEVLRPRSPLPAASVANHNAAGQVVAAGTTEALDRLAADRARRAPGSGRSRSPARSTPR